MCIYIYVCVSVFWFVLYFYLISYCCTSRSIRNPTGTSQWHDTNPAVSPLRCGPWQVQGEAHDIKREDCSRGVLLWSNCWECASRIPTKSQDIGGVGCVVLGCVGWINLSGVAERGTVFASNELLNSDAWSNILIYKPFGDRYWSKRLPTRKCRPAKLVQLVINSIWGWIPWHKYMQIMYGLCNIFLGIRILLALCFINHHLCGSFDASPLASC